MDKTFGTGKFTTLSNPVSRAMWSPECQNSSNHWTRTVQGLVVWQWQVIHHHPRLEKRDWFLHYSRTWSGGGIHQQQHQHEIGKGPILFGIGFCTTRGRGVNHRHEIGKGPKPTFPTFPLEAYGRSLRQSPLIPKDQRNPCHDHVDQCQTTQDERA
jgi:hypothetical protein